MSVTTPRPPRTTANYGWPIAGDADPADYVTYTGNLADAIDATLFNAGGVPLITPAQLSQAPYNAPTDGQTVDLLVDATNQIIWRLRYRAAIPAAPKWVFVGGGAVSVYDSGVSGTGAANAWSPITPAFVTPRPGIYQAEQKAEGFASAGAATVLLDLQAVAGQTVYVAQTSGEATLAAGSVETVICWGTTSVLGVGTNLTTAFNPNAAGVALARRGLRIWPVRLQ